MYKVKDYAWKLLHEYGLEAFIKVDFMFMDSFDVAYYVYDYEYCTTKYFYNAKDFINYVRHIVRLEMWGMNK